VVFVEVPAGWFWMGWDAGVASERPRHRVWLDGFAIATHPVTNAQYAEFLAPMTFAAPRIPVVANATAQPYPSVNVSESIKTLLVDQITHSVQWTQTVRLLIGQGVTRFIELGPGNVLTRMVQQIHAKAA